MTSKRSTPERDTAQRVRERYAAAADKIRGNPDLTDKARARQIGELYQQTRQELGRLAELDTMRLDAQMAEVDKTVFGGLRPSLTGGADQHTSIRDAVDRARVTTSAAQAQQLLDQAERTGDKALASAVAQVADERAYHAITPDAGEEWRNVYHSYISARPHLMGPLAEARDIHELRAEAQGLMDSPFRVTKPQEARQHELDQQHEAATGADDQPSTLTR